MVKVWYLRDWILIEICILFFMIKNPYLLTTLDQEILLTLCQNTNKFQKRWRVLHPHPLLSLLAWHALRYIKVPCIYDVVHSIFYSIKPDTFWLHREQPQSPLPTSPSPHFPTDDHTKASITFSWHLIFYVKNYYGVVNITSWLARNKTLWTSKFNRCSS